MSDLKLWIKDLTDGTVRQYGTNGHDSLQVRDGVLEYYNLQNGDGTPSGYAFCNEDGTTHWLTDGPEHDEKYVHIGLANQKQIPKKPRFYDSKFRQRGQKYGEFVTIEDAYNCPNCNCTVWGTDKDEYCKHCGQALDWGLE